MAVDRVAYTDGHVIILIFYLYYTYNVSVKSRKM